MPKYAVIILNWNGAEDTIACVDSVLASDSMALPIVVDNGSSDDSLEQLWTALHASDRRLLTLREDSWECGEQDAALADAVLLKSQKNLGFAGGCNLGLQLARALGTIEVVFLNNDTIVHRGSLTALVERLRCDRSVFAVLPQIRIYGTDRIWNCGGTISSLGFRRYHFSGAFASKVNLPPELPSSFFTGCCFAVRTDEFAARKGFSERYFFGEEDFELGLWMKDHRRRAVCITSAIIEHKVSASIGRAGSNPAAKVYVHYLNRLTHMRLRFGIWRWILWLLPYVPYIAYLLLRRSIISPREVIPFFRALLGEAVISVGVDRQRFEAIIRDKPW
jgi:GT2 family glycosyltransferase